VRDRQRRAGPPAALGRGDAVPELRAIGDGRQLPRPGRRAGDQPAAGAVRPHLQQARRAVSLVLAIAGAPCSRAPAGSSCRGRRRGGHGGEPHRAGGRRHPVRVQPAAGRRGAPDRAGQHLRSQRAAAGVEQSREIAGIPRPTRRRASRRRRATGSERCYPARAAAFHLLGDWTTQVNWGAPNSSYVERDRDIRLKGFDDRPRVVETVNPRTGRARAPRSATTANCCRSRAIASTGARSRAHPAGARPRRVPDDRRQAAGARRRGAAAAHGGRGHRRGAAVVLDVAAAACWPR
jgi:hypothetical protein